MKEYPLYKNPYDAFHIDKDTVLQLHAVGMGESDLTRIVPSLSPFAAKLEAYLRLFKVPYEFVSEPVPDVGPRGKIPFVSVGDTKLADSQLIIDFLKRTIGDPDADLAPAQKALGHVIQRTLEDHLYWIIIYYEFFDDNGNGFLMNQLVGDTTALPQDIQDAIALRREDFRKRCYDQGIARFTPQEVIAKANKDFDAISQILGDNRYLLGTDQPTSYDAVLFGFTVAFFQARSMHPEITDHVRVIPNLGRYIHDMLATFYPEIELEFEPA